MNDKDRSTAFAKWPRYVRGDDDFPGLFADVMPMMNWCHHDYYGPLLIYCPVQKDEDWKDELIFGYHNNRMFFQYPQQPMVEMTRASIHSVVMETELLNAKLILSTDVPGHETLEIRYVAAAHEMFDRFLAWLFHKEDGFSLLKAERRHPRPERLKEQSLSMFNYALPVYYLADGFDDYQYRSQVHRHHLFPWRKTLEEWLDVPLKHGAVHIHLHGYSLSTALSWNAEQS